MKEYDLRTIYQLPLDDQKTWNLFAEGRTIGVFQLEKPLGRTFSKKLKPENIHHLAALLSLLRPGCLQAKDSEGVSMTDHYIKRKNGLEETTYYHKSLEHILSSTYSVLVFQEQMMRIVAELAGFDKVEVDRIRKACGKKDAQEMSDCCKLFVEKAKVHGVVNEEQAQQIIEWIKESARYSFNACVSGDTMIRKSSNGGKKIFNWNVREAYKIRNSLEYSKISGHSVLRRKWMRLGCYGKGWSMCEDGRVRPNKIIDIRYAGYQEVFLVTLENDATIEVTMTHKFPTPNGELRLSDLSVGDELFVCGEYEKNTERYGWSDVTLEDIKERKVGKVSGAFGESNFAYTNGAWSEFEQNKKLLPDHCQECSKIHRRLEIHHIDGDRTNSAIENLKKLCPSCHKKAEYKKGRVKRGEKGYPTLTSKIKSIESLGIKDTYDIEMDAPNHNFVVESNIITSNSHAYGYAMNSYVNAYLKANHPLDFYLGWLSNSDNGPDSQDTIAELVEDAKYLDIEILPPCIINSEDQFSIKDGKIWFGLGNIKGIGEFQVRKVRECLSNLEKQLGKTLKDISWRELIVFSDIPNGTLINFINAGVFRHFGNRRKQMAFQAKNFIVSDKQLEWMREHFYEYKSNVELLEAAARTKKEGGACHDKRGVSKLLSIVDIYKNPPIDMKDYPDEIADLESDLLGVALTCSRLDKFNANQADTNIKDFLRGKKSELMVFAIELKEVREYTITKGESEGRTMAFCKVCDQTGSCDMVAFSDIYDLMQEEDLAYPGAKLLVAAKPSQKNDGSLIIERVKELKIN